MKLNFLSLKPTTPQCLQKLMHRQTEIPRQAETQRICKMPLLQEQRQYIKMQPKMMPTQQIAQRQSGRLQTKRAGQSELHIKLALQTTLRLRSFAFELCACFPAVISFSANSAKIFEAMCEGLFSSAITRCSFSTPASSKYFAVEFDSICSLIRWQVFELSFKLT